MTRHQYGISALVPQTSFGGETSLASPNVFSGYCLTGAFYANDFCYDFLAVLSGFSNVYVAVKIGYIWCKELPAKADFWKLVNKKYQSKSRFETMENLAVKKLPWTRSYVWKPLKILYSRLILTKKIFVFSTCNCFLVTASSCQETVFLTGAMSVN